MAPKIKMAGGGRSYLGRIFIVVRVNSCRRQDVGCACDSGCCLMLDIRSPVVHSSDFCDRPTTAICIYGDFDGRNVSAPGTYL